MKTASRFTNVYFQKKLIINSCLVFFFLDLFFAVDAQYTIRFEVYDPAMKKDLYLAGDFNSWNPGDAAFKLNPLVAGHYFIVIKNISRGKHVFKFTRGQWNTVEITEFGINRSIDVKKDTVLQLQIRGWNDDDAPAFTNPKDKFTVRFDVYNNPPKDQIFLAGTFNNFNPGDHNFLLRTIDPTHSSITVKDIKPGKYLFKFTRGSWGTVETNALGQDIEDRILVLKKDTILKLSISGWIDNYVDLSKLADTTAIKIGMMRSYYYRDINLDSSYNYAMASFLLSRKIDNKKLQVNSLIALAEVFQKQGNFAKSLEMLMQASPVAESLHDSFQAALVYKNMGEIFQSQEEYIKAKYCYQASIKYCSLTDIRAIFMSQSLLNIGIIFFKESNLDSASFYAEKSNDINPTTNSLILFGDIEKKLGNNGKAMDNFQKALKNESLTANISANFAIALQRIAGEFARNNQPDSGVYYAALSWQTANLVKDPVVIRDASILLAGLYEQQKKFDSAFYYQKIGLLVNDSLFSKEKENQIHNLVLNDQIYKKDLQAEKEKFRSRTWIYSLAGGILFLLLMATLLFRNNKQKKAANLLLSQQKNTIEKTLSELRATQAQLIQSEKMASLGELTAGIAHEIQNPLNFVNNFSEINKELLSEMTEEIAKGNLDEVKAIAKDITDNEQKIIVHGKRADAIVKGMLQHSSKSSGIKEFVEINALADEYLRLSYHARLNDAVGQGLRAKDKSFNASIKTSFDNTIGKIQVIPQDIGRVLLNLYNNAFYAVDEKFKQGDSHYEPTVSVSTKKEGKKIIISVKDNGNGIPVKIRDKIFQPFFTTRPPGEGTGLGLSLSYDIVKAHGGEIQVESSEGTGTSMIIFLPA